MTVIEFIRQTLPTARVEDITGSPSWEGMRFAVRLNCLEPVEWGSDSPKMMCDLAREFARANDPWNVGCCNSPNVPKYQHKCINCGRDY